MSEHMPKFTILLPCYNEYAAIGATVNALTAALNTRFDFEIIAVNDGSSDDTGPALRALAAQDARIHLIEHDHNRGYGAALKSGLRQARGDYVAIIDADGSYPVADLSTLLELSADYDMVVGARTGEAVAHSRLRLIPKYFMRHWVSWIARARVPDINSGLRVFRREVAERFVGILPDGFSFTITITLAMLTSYYRVHFHPISYANRVGISKIQPVRDTLRFLTIIARTGMYFAPMRVLAPTVLVLLLGALASFLYDVFVLEDLTDKTVLLFLFTLNTGMLALLADMIDKRTARR